MRKRKRGKLWKTDGHEALGGQTDSTEYGSSDRLDQGEGSGSKVTMKASTQRGI